MLFKLFKNTFINDKSTNIFTRNSFLKKLFKQRKNYNLYIFDSLIISLNLL